MDEVTKVTTPLEWQAAISQKWVIKLPSGVNVVVRRPDLGRVLLEGATTEQALAGLRQREGFYNSETVALAKAMLPYILQEPQMDAESMWLADLMMIFMWGLGFSAASGVPYEPPAQEGEANG